MLLTEKIFNELKKNFMIYRKVFYDTIPELDIMDIKENIPSITGDRVYQYATIQSRITKRTKQSIIKFDLENDIISLVISINDETKEYQIYPKDIFDLKNKENLFLHYDSNPNTIRLDDKSLNIYLALYSFIYYINYNIDQIDIINDTIIPSKYSETYGYIIKMISAYYNNFLLRDITSIKDFTINYNKEIGRDDIYDFSFLSEEDLEDIACKNKPPINLNIEELCKKFLDFISNIDGNIDIDIESRNDDYIDFNVRLIGGDPCFPYTSHLVFDFNLGEIRYEAQYFDQDKNLTDTKEIATFWSESKNIYPAKKYDSDLQMLCRTDTIYNYVFYQKEIKGRMI